LLAAGWYAVKQSFKDGRGNTKTVTSNVYLSHKKLYWYTRSQTRYADTGAFYWNGYAGAYKSTRYYRGVELDGGWYDDEAAIARYTFSLPSATVYSSVKASVYGKSISPYGQGGLMLQNWLTDELDGTKLLGYSTNWYSSKVGAAAHVNSNHSVRVYVAAVGTNYGLVDFQKVKLTYTFALLK
jgi:hypothetical protein